VCWSGSKNAVTHPNHGDLAKPRQCWRRRAAGSWACSCNAGAPVDPPRGGPLGGSGVGELLLGVSCVGITAFPCVDVLNGRHVLVAEGRVAWPTCWRWVLVAVTIEHHHR